MRLLAVENFVYQQLCGKLSHIRTCGTNAMTINTLNNWNVVHGNSPDDGRYVACIEGEVLSTNSRFPKASRIRTSYLTYYEMHASSMVVVTVHGSEYLLGNPGSSEYLALEFFKRFLPERKGAPVPEFDGVRTHVIAYTESADPEDAE